MEKQLSLLQDPVFEVGPKKKVDAKLNRAQQCCHNQKKALKATNIHQKNGDNKQKVKNCADNFLTTQLTEALLQTIKDPQQLAHLKAVLAANQNK